MYFGFYFAFGYFIFHRSKQLKALKEIIPPSQYLIRKGDLQLLGLSAPRMLTGVYLYNHYTTNVNYKYLSAQDGVGQNFSIELGYNNSDGTINLCSISTGKFLDSQTFKFTANSSAESKFEFYDIQIKGGVMVRSVPGWKNLSDEVLFFEKPTTTEPITIEM